MTIKAIETRYKGYLFRSRLEARWAVFFDALGVRYEYEKEGFNLDGINYLPDFWLPDYKEWVEIKPEGAPVIERVYLAGKMIMWRNKVDLRGHACVGPDMYLKHSGASWHLTDGETPYKEIVKSCRNSLHEANVVIAWVDSMDCFGTLAEIGYAIAIKKRVVLGISSLLYPRLQAKADREYQDRGSCESTPPAHAMWFIEHFCSETVVVVDPQQVVDKVIPSYTDEEEKCTRLADLGFQVNLLHGEPWDGCYQTIGFNPQHTTRNHRPSFTYWLPTPGNPKGVYDGRLRNEDDLQRAYVAAGSARFEHGHSGRTL